jgi:hypothetical protein
MGAPAKPLAPRPDRGRTGAHLVIIAPARASTAPSLGC